VIGIVFRRFIDVNFVGMLLCAVAYGTTSSAYSPEIYRKRNKVVALYSWFIRVSNADYLSLVVQLN